MTRLTALTLTLLFLAAIVYSVADSKDISAEYIVEVKGKCESECLESVRSSLSSSVTSECALITPQAVIGDLTFVFLKCEGAKGAPKATDISAAGATVVSVSKNKKVQKKGIPKSRSGYKRLKPKARFIDDGFGSLFGFGFDVSVPEGAPSPLADLDDVVPERMQGEIDNVNERFFPSPTPSSSATPSPTPIMSPTKPPTWGVDEVDGSDDNKRSCKNSKNGEGIIVAVLDTGCTPSAGGYCDNTIGDPSGTCVDRDGHGTHVAGTIQDPNYGVATSCTVSCVKVLDDEDGYGDYIQLIQGISKAIDNGAAVINLSLGGYEEDGEEGAEILDDAIVEAGKEGTYFAISSGNEDVNSCLTSPGRTNGDNIYTVQAHDEDGVIMEGSNWGTCTNLTAPGVDILSYEVEETEEGSNEYVPVLESADGTSMAAPHVAGIIARMLSDGQKISEASLTELGRVIKDRENYDVRSLAPRCP